MASRKPKAGAASRAPDSSSPSNATDGLGSAFSTVSGPATGVPAGGAQASEAAQRLAAKHAATDALARAMPSNPLKPHEHGLDAGHRPEAGVAHAPDDEAHTGSTLSETSESDKIGDGIPMPGFNPMTASLDRVRVDSGGQRLTTNQGVKIGDNQNSLKAGLRGPALLEDFILREKITHFDHERIPERIVHARGSGAHGYFECYEPLTDITVAAPFAAAGKKTPVFVRFSTVAGERGSADTVRDVRGFATKFYTEDGNWDLVGNNIPVFFIQDAMKFPDLVHALKPEPHHAMPQASSAHDTFWDFVSLMPESAHMLMWVMSDRAIPRSYRTMQGFGVHTFRLVNAEGHSVFCKFHWQPVAGTHSLVWDEAAKITGADPDFHRRDLWESIEAGVYPEYELGLQIFSEEQADSFGFDILDATKIVPEELVPVRIVGRMVLNRNPDNFFAETEQIAFCTAHIVPGIDFTNDPLLQGRIHSYVDTQLSRLGGPNFHEIPINAPITQIHNNQRDGMHRQAVHRGRAAYEPNSLGGGCPFQAGMAGFVSFPQPVQEDKVRGKPELFADHYSQATLFWRSQTPVEQNHIAAAFRFELTRVQTPAVRERVVSVLANVDKELAQKVADGLGMQVPPPQPLAAGKKFPLPVERSPALSLMARPGKAAVRGRRVAILVAEGIDAATARLSYDALLQAEAVPRYVGVRLGNVKAANGETLPVEISLEASPSVLWDGLIVPDGERAAQAFLELGQALDFAKDQFRHCKPILGFGSASTFFEGAGVGSANTPELGRLMVGADALEADRIDSTAEGIATFIVALARHRHFARESDPPPL